MTAIVGKYFAKEKAGKKQPESAKIKTYFPNARAIVITPAAGEIVTINRGNNDHKTFEPHTYVYYNAHEKVNAIFRLNLRNQNTCGETTLQNIIPQYAHP